MGFSVRGGGGSIYFSMARKRGGGGHYVEGYERMGGKTFSWLEGKPGRILWGDESKPECRQWESGESPGFQNTVFQNDLLKIKDLRGKTN